MLLSPHEQERLLVHVAAGLAHQRRGRGLKLNYPEAVAVISAWVLEGARDGHLTSRATGRDLVHGLLHGPGGHGLSGFSGSWSVGIG